MADSVTDQIRRYWLVIVAVFIATAGLMTMMAQISDRLTKLETTVSINVTALRAFADQGPRFTMQDGNALDRRVTVLEQYHRNGD